MFKFFKKSFWVPYSNSSVYPSVLVSKDAIASYCQKQNWNYEFINDETVKIDDKIYSIYRGYETGSRGNYGIKCIEQ